jgi:gas vesicle protein
MKPNIRTLTLVIGTLAGAFIGYRAAMTFIEQSEAENKSLPITAQQGLQVGLTALGVLKQITSISQNKK